MGIEIERKFLVLESKFEPTPDPTLIDQGYLFSDEKSSVRVRTFGEKAFITVKSTITDVSRREYEYEIPFADALEMLVSISRFGRLTKKRHHITHDGDEWIVDEFTGSHQGLVIAELELKSESQKFSAPSWLGAEVTHDPRYINSNLAKQKC